MEESVFYPVGAMKAMKRRKALLDERKKRRVEIRKEKATEQKQTRLTKAQILNERRLEAVRSVAKETVALTNSLRRAKTLGLNVRLYWKSNDTPPHIHAFVNKKDDQYTVYSGSCEGVI